MVNKLIKNEMLISYYNYDKTKKENLPFISLHIQLSIPHPMTDEEVDAYRGDGQIQPSYYDILSTVSSDDDATPSYYYPIEDEMQVMVEAVMEAEDRLDVKRRKLWGSKRNRINKNAKKNKNRNWNRNKHRGNCSEYLPQTKQELVWSGMVESDVRFVVDSDSSSCCSSSVDFSLVTQVDECNVAAFIRR